MKFPGSKLLQQWDLSTRPLSFEDLFRSCREIGLTGLAELRLRDTVGLIFYYLGGAGLMAAYLNRARRVPREGPRPGGGAPIPAPAGRA